MISLVKTELELFTSNPPGKGRDLKLQQPISHLCPPPVGIAPVAPSLFWYHFYLIDLQELIDIKNTKLF